MKLFKDAEVGRDIFSNGGMGTTACALSVDLRAILLKYVHTGFDGTDTTWVGERLIPDEELLVLSYSEEFSASQSSERFFTRL